ncbi:MAG: hypothetical protein COA78_01690 [Blastopirellula sp.]|nr:MAG: hypothetical protein COA78_01690 [Blastopirellula sp.]
MRCSISLRFIPLCLLLLAGFSTEILAKETPPKTIASFGVIGDGMADDTEAIQRAVDSKLGDICFPRGVYKLTKTIVIDLDQLGPTSLIGTGTATIEMHGSGPAFHFIGTHLKGTAAPHTFEEKVWKNQRTPIVRGIEIVGHHADANGIEATGTMQLTISEVVIRHTLHSIHLTQRNRNVIVSNCHLYENRGVGLYLDDLSLHQINVIGSHISYNNAGGIVVRAGDVRNLHITGCDLEGNMGDADAPSTANVLIDCTDGSIGEVAITGCTIQHTYKGKDSANIRFIGPSNKRSFTDEQRDGNITISSNILSDTQCNIDIHKMRGVAITGNTIWKGFQHNVKLTGCTSVVMTGNTMDRNPRYGYGDGKKFANAILLNSCTDCIFANNLISGVRSPEGGVRIKNCKRLNLNHCTIVNCDVASIWATNVSNSIISGCILGQDDVEKTDWKPLVLDKASANQKSKNQIQSN